MSFFSKAWRALVNTLAAKLGIPVTRRPGSVHVIIIDEKAVMQSEVRSVALKSPVDGAFDVHFISEGARTLDGTNKATFVGGEARLRIVHPWTGDRHVVGFVSVPHEP